MQLQTFEWYAADNQKNFGQLWTPSADALKGIICIIHGLGEHSNRYQHVAQFFTNKGYAVISGDLRGHGKSEGKRGHVANYNILLQHVEYLIAHAQQTLQNEQLPVWIYGHSMGGNISLNYAYYKPKHAKGIILSAPFLRTGKPIPALKLMLAKIMIKIWDAYTENNGIDPKDISRTSAVVKNYINDPLVHPYISVRWFFDSYNRAQDLLNNKAAQLTQPLLIMHGTADKLTNHNASLEFSQKAPPSMVTFKSWQGLYHELHNEPEQNEVLQYALNWIENT